MIALKNISKTYDMGLIKVKALQDVSLTIASGEFVAIMGPSGSGKSTLMHVLGLLDRPDQGEYYLGTKLINKLSDDDLSSMRNRLAGFVFQQFHLLPRMTALENAALPLIYSGDEPTNHNAQQKMAEVGLKERMHHRPNELSGGQQQRVAIARALVNDPPIIFADEPTGNLDSKSKQEILSILKALNHQGKTIVMVTHEPEVAAHAQRVIRMVDGRIVADEKKAEEVKRQAPRQVDVVPENVFAHSTKRIKKIRFFDYLRQAGGSMISHKMRSFLSILGILIGVAAVIAMLALGQGAKQSIEKQLASLGSNLLVVRPGSSKVHGVATGAGVVTRLTLQDVAAIAKLGEGVKGASPSVTGKGQLVYGNKNWNTQLEGVNTDYAAIRASFPEVGRFFTDEDIRMRRKVALVGPTVAKELFGNENPVGQTMKINLLNFKIIGVLRSKGANTFRDQDDVVLMPITTAMYRVLGKAYVDSIYVETEAPEVMEAAQQAIEEMIIKKHRLKKDSDSFEIRNMADIKNALETTTKTMSLLLGAIAAISLLVGGIGIMNIMLVSVTERTREIGLRKAIGANNKDIMVQFLIEAVLMSLIGGICGILLGSGVAMLITAVAGWAAAISLTSIVLATVFSLGVGIIFGLWPAQKAAQLNPIEALRYE